MTNIMITGSASGLGAAIYDEAKQAGMNAIGVDIKKGDSKRIDYMCDVSRESSVVKMAKAIDHLDILVNCAGVNYIEHIDTLSFDEYDKVFSINTKGPAMMVKYLLPQLIRSTGTIVNVISNAYHMPMTHSLAYNGSKGALAIMTRQMARELTKKYGIAVFGINPNKMEGTIMSRYIEGRVPELRGWTPEQAAKYQKDSLLAGMETKVEWIAELLVWLLSKSHRHRYLSGCLLDLGL